MGATPYLLTIFISGYWWYIPLHEIFLPCIQAIWPSATVVVRTPISQACGVAAGRVNIPEPGCGMPTTCGVAAGRVNNGRTWCTCGVATTNTQTQLFPVDLFLGPKIVAFVIFSLCLKSSLMFTSTMSSIRRG